MIAQQLHAPAGGDEEEPVLDLGSLAGVGRAVARAAGMDLAEAPVEGLPAGRPQVQQWRKHEFPRSRAATKREKAESYFADGSGVRSDLHSGKIRALKGETPIVRRTGQRFSLNMICVISRRGALRVMLVKGAVGDRVFTGFQQRLMHGQCRPVYLIVDGHPSHRAKAMKQYLDSLEGRLKLFFLPPHSAQLNPGELDWNDEKNNADGRATRRSQEFALPGRLRFLQKLPDRVRSVFSAPETCYAAA